MFGTENGVEELFVSFGKTNVGDIDVKMLWRV